MKKYLFLIFFLGIATIVSAQSVKVLGPEVVCQRSFATFDANPMAITGAISKIRWTIPNADFIAGKAESDELDNRNVTVHFTSSGTFTVGVVYSYLDSQNVIKTVSDSRSIVVKDCPTFQCEGADAESVFFEDFGTLSVADARQPLAPPSATPYKYAGLGDVENGHYVLTGNPHAVADSLVNSQDHSVPSEGAMMLVNASRIPDTFYTTVLKEVCGGGNYMFSAWFMNINTRATLDSGCNGDYLFPNVTLEIIDAKTGISLGKTKTNGISMKLKDKWIDDPAWQSYGFNFKVPVGTDSIRLLLYNNNEGGCGNKFAVDDIKIEHCLPAVKAYFEKPETKKTISCVGDSVSIRSQFTPAYFNHPEFQWQFSKDQKLWTDIPDAVDAGYILSVVDTSDSGYYRYRVFEQGNKGEEDCVFVSDTVALTVHPKLEIKEQPQHHAVCVDGDVSFKINATGSHLTYQWESSKDKGNTWQEISGETASTLSLAKVQATDSGIVYRVVVDSDCGRDTSKEALLSVVSDVKIIHQPQSETACDGTDVSFKMIANTTNLSYQWRYATDGGITWEDLQGATTSTLHLSDVQMKASGNKYYVVAQSECKTLISKIATLNVKRNLEINNQPHDQAVCESSDASFSIDVSGSNLSLQWQSSIDTGKTWSAVSGANSALLALHDVQKADSGTKYRVVIHSACAIDTSAVATLSVDNKIIITKEPQDYTACLDSTATFTVGTQGANLSYQWMSSVDNGISWNQIPGADQATLTLPKRKEADDGTAYYAVIQGTCETKISQIVTLNVDPKMVILNKPKDQTKCEGDNVSFEIDAKGTDLSFQWLSSTDGGTTWNKMVGETDHILNLSDLKNADSGSLFSVVVSDHCVSDTSQPVILHVNPKLALTGKLQDEVACVNGDVAFQMNVSGANLTYQWFSSTDGGTNWNEVPGETKDVLALSNVRTAENNTKYYAVVHSNCGRIRSNVATLNIVPEVQVTKKPQDQIVCEGDAATFQIEATGSNLSYQWQYSADGGSHWNAIPGGTDAALNLLNVSATQDGYLYRTVINSVCGTAISDAATLSVNPQVSITKQPQQKGVCVGSSTAFDITAQGQHLSYQWMSSTDGGHTWQEVPGATTPTLSLSNVQPVDSGTQYYMNVRSSCSNTNSETVTLDVFNDLTIDRQPNDTAVHVGFNAYFNVKAAGANLSYQWQSSDDGGVSWNDIPQDTFPVLWLPSVSTAQSGTAYRAMINSDCGNTISDAAALAVNTGGSPVVCEGGDKTYSLETSAADLGYQWRYSTDGGHKWADIPGETNATLHLNNITKSQGGTRYKGIVFKSPKNDTSKVYSFGVLTKTKIVNEPADREVCMNSDVKFSSNAVGVNLSYQWQSSLDDANWTDISSGGNATSLSLSDVQPSDSGTKFRLVVNGVCGSDTSREVILKVNSKIAIVTSPQEQKVCMGSDVSFQVEAMGSVRSYQWFSSTDGGTHWDKIVGATHKMLQVSDVMPADSGTEYYVVVGGACGSQVSEIAKLIVNRKINITKEPQDQTVCEGSNVVFGVDAAGFNMTYQWQSSADSGKTWEDIPGAVNSVLNLTKVSPKQSEIFYRAVLKGNCDKDTSKAAKLIVNPKIPITKEPQDQEVCDGSTISFKVEAKGLDLSYQWLSSIDSGATWNKIPGETSPLLTLSDVQPVDSGTQYYVVVRGNCWSSISRIATLSVKGTQAIHKNPQDKTVCEGSKVAFSIEADGIHLSYQWQLSEDGGNTWNNISGATDISLDLGQVAASQNGNKYRALVNGDCNKNISTAALLTVKSSATITRQPNSHIVCEGENTSFEIGVKGTDFSVQWKTSTDGGVSWHKVTGATSPGLNLVDVKATDNGTKYYAIISSSCKTLISKVVTLGVKPLIDITRQPLNQAVCKGGRASFYLEAEGADLSFQWWSSIDNGASWQKVAGATHTRWTISNAQVADSGTKYRVTLDSDCDRDTSDVVGLTVHPLVSLTNGPRDTTVCSGSDVSFEIDVKGSHLSYHWMVSKNHGVSWNSVSGASAAVLNLSDVQTADNGKEYYAIVHGDCGIIISEIVTLTVKPDAAITDEPQDQKICENENVSFLVKATGPYLTYQWQFSRNGKDWSEVASGGENKILNLPNVQSKDSGMKYRVIVRSDCKRAISDPATLSVLSNAVIVKEPEDKAVCVNGTVSFLTKATGSDLRYQWRSSTDNGSSWTDIAGENKATLTLTHLGLNQNGRKYQVVISNDCNVVLSSAVHLKVKPNAKIIAPPTDTTVCVNTIATFSVTASGPDLTYQWQSSIDDGQSWENVVGENKALLKLTDPSVAQSSTRYRVIVNSDCESAVSESATLTVWPDAEITVPPQNISVCVHGDASFEVTATGIHLSYQWQSSTDGGNNWQNIASDGRKNELNLSKVTFSQDGHLYRAIVESNCQSTTSKPVKLTVTEGHFPTVRIVAGDTLICQQDKVQLLALGKYEESYLWDDGSRNSLFTAQQPGKYWVQVSNKCGIAKDSVILKQGIDCVEDILVPTAFSPNGDGANDVFRPFLRHRVSDYEFQIFDRWGDRVFWTKNPEKGWNGTNKGKPSAFGTYIWVISYKKVSSKAVLVKKGTIVLIR